MLKKILLINGPNLNLLGKREKTIYGNLTLKQIEANAIEYAQSKKMQLDCFQSNHEGAIIDKIHSADQQFDGIIINAGAYTHTSVAIRDAIAGISVPAIEVHLSNIYKREKFRHHSFLSDVCVGQIAGFGFHSYLLAINYFHLLNSKEGK